MPPLDETAALEKKKLAREKKKARRCVHGYLLYSPNVQEGHTDNSGPGHKLFSQLLRPKKERQKKENERRRRRRNQSGKKKREKRQHKRHKSCEK